MLCLGLEGTAHSVGVGIVESFSSDNGSAPVTSTGSTQKVIANEIMMYSPAEGGIHPREAANHHAANVVPLITETLAKAGLEAKDIDLVAFSQGPGLGPCLRTVATAARALALSLDVPIMGVNHCIAHLEIGVATTGAVDPVLLYASGGNTQIIAFSNGKYRIFGETLDIGIGNMLDKFGREVGMAFPAGPKIEVLAKESDVLLDIPYSVKGMDVSFSGILTSALNLHRKGTRLEDICNSLQETCFAMLTEVTERAMAHTEKDEVLLGGGVARNSYLQKMVSTMADHRDARSFVPAGKLCVDNGAMIASTGLIMYDGGVRMDVKDTVIDQRYRTDAVEVVWR